MRTWRIQVPSLTPKKSGALPGHCDGHWLRPQNPAASSDPARPRCHDGSVTSPTARRILIVEDNASVRALLEGSVRDLGFEVEAVPDSRAAILAADRLDPDAAILDVDLGDRPNGIELGHLLRTRAPHLGIVYFTHYPSAALAGGPLALPPGSAFVNKTSLASTEELRQAIESTLSDGADPVSVVPTPSDNPLARLTRRQLEVLSDIAAGYSNSQIAERRERSLSATERLVARTFSALGIPHDASRNPRVLATRIYLRHSSIPEVSPAP